MSVTGPGCAECNFTGRVPWSSEPGMEGAFGVKPCDRCGGFSQFRHADEPARLLGGAVDPATFARVLAAIEADRVRWQDHEPSCIHDTIGRGACSDCDPHESAAAAVRRELAAPISPEDDFRPLPSVAEVLAHNARTGGDCFGPWLMLCESDEYPHGARVEVVHIATDDDALEVRDNAHDRVRDWRGSPKFRPITRRGAALPWPEVPR